MGPYFSFTGHLSVKHKSGRVGSKLLMQTEHLLSNSPGGLREEFTLTETHLWFVRKPCVWGWFSEGNERV